MINKDTVKSRLDSGISYTEFSYQILQALDFEHLFATENCVMQVGGQDQWGNITSGLELIRKIPGAEASAYGVTVPLFTKSDGTKFGKTEGGAIWIDPKKTSPYAFYQFWINTPDNDVIRELKQFTFLSKEEIETLEESFVKEPHLRAAQKALAKEMTIMIHGEEAYNQAVKMSEALFSGKIADLTKEEIEILFEGLPRVEMAEDTLLIDVLVNVGVCSSKREAREFIGNSSITLNGEKVTDLDFYRSIFLVWKKVFQRKD